MPEFRLRAVIDKIAFNKEYNAESVNAFYYP